MQTMDDEKRTWLERAPFPTFPALTNEILIFAVIILLAFATRFYDLETRVMSHDESLHTQFSWYLYRGQGYQHNPMMHGPLQFHMLALSYFMFGASDLTARIPAVLFNIATILMVWHWRKYIGRAGALVAGALLLISPYILYYGRYVRNEAFVGLSGIILLYAILRYLETGRHRYIYMLSGATVLHFLVKETSFIYTAQALLFFAIFFIVQMTRAKWKNLTLYRSFIVEVVIGIILIVSAVMLLRSGGDSTAFTGAETLAPIDPTAETSPFAPISESTNIPALVAGVLGVFAFGAAAYSLIKGYGWEGIRSERSFDLLMALGTLVLPSLTPFLIHAVGWNPLDYSLNTCPAPPELNGFQAFFAAFASEECRAVLASSGMIRTLLMLTPVTVITVAIGLWWNASVWLKMTAIFYVPFVLFYTTIFTNGGGFFSGLIGSLGYWLEQHDVQRGSQPWYYYILIQIPLYEFLPFLASLVALAFGFWRKMLFGENTSPEQQANSVRTWALLGWWSFSSLMAFSIAGEKMPWLTFHIALPMILWGGWAIGRIIDTTDWQAIRENRPWLLLGFLTLFILSAFGMFNAALSPIPPFQGSTIEQLQSTSSFLFAVFMLAGSSVGLYYALRHWHPAPVMSLMALVVFGLLAVLTTRATIRANYIMYDSAEEYLVYAHGYTGVKDVLSHVRDISERTAGGTAGIVAYDDDVPWPVSWYLRDYPNARFYGNNPTRDLRQVPVIIVGDNNFSKIEPIVRDEFYRIDYIRMVWPNQDYFGLTPERVQNALSDPRIRAGIFQIWLNRDYRLYAQATNNSNLTPENWQPSDRMRLYIRNDIAAQIWNYGVGPVAQKESLYKPFITSIAADTVVGTLGTGNAQFNAPRGIAFAPDGSYYVADSRNHRIQHLSANGEVLQIWGVFGDNTLQSAPLGAFNEPWGIAVGPDGSVYVSDTWNHRVQKFSATGQPILSWGTFGQADQNEAFWGPRGLAVDSQGRVYVADTGNKRIVVYDRNGVYLTQFGSDGFSPGQFSEPVSVAIAPDGTVYVTDTWNQRMQSFISTDDGLSFFPLAQWDIDGWNGQSLDNKPFVSVAPNGNVFITDPEGYRVLEFTSSGQIVRVWGDFGVGLTDFGLASGIAVDKAGRIWVTDAGNHRIMRFTLP
jgi:predicted membrane-bound mannosyltransferase/DNA-binding beta-propeller fold protein YncE